MNFPETKFSGTTAGSVTVVLFGAVILVIGILMGHTGLIFGSLFVMVVGAALTLA